MFRRIHIRSGSAIFYTRNASDAAEEGFGAAGILRRCHATQHTHRHDRNRRLSKREPRKPSRDIGLQDATPVGILEKTPSTFLIPQLLTPFSDSDIHGSGRRNVISDTCLAKCSRSGKRLAELMPSLFNMSLKLCFAEADTSYLMRNSS